MCALFYLARNEDLLLVAFAFGLRRRIDLAKIGKSIKLAQLVFVGKFDITPIAHGHRLPSRKNQPRGKEVPRAGVVTRTRTRRGLPCGKGLATHNRVDGIERGQAMNIRNAAHRDRSGQILNVALHTGERWLGGKARAIWIARSREVDPERGHLLCQLPICWSPVPGRLV